MSILRWNPITQSATVVAVLAVAAATMAASQAATGLRPLISPRSPAAGCQYLWPRSARLGPLCGAQRVHNSRNDSHSGPTPPPPSWTHIVDLTHALGERTPYIPIPGLTFPFKKTPIATLEKNGVAAYRWEIHEHIGTQIDAPSHFIDGGAGLDALPVESLIVPLVIIDIANRARADADAAVTVRDILEWEKTHGPLPARAAVLMHSGWDAKIADAPAFVNSDGAGTMHFPGFSPEAATFLARERDVSGIGVDTLSVDPGIDKTYQAHRVWLATGKWAVELVANLEHVPPVGATIFVGASKVEGATGGPVRLIAVW